MMAALLGINIPVNSVGVIPDIDVNVPGYMQLRGGEKAKARAALVNAKVIMEHYRVKHGKLTAICNVRIPWIANQGILDVRAESISCRALRAIQRACFFARSGAGTRHRSSFRFRRFFQCWRIRSREAESHRSHQFNAKGITLSRDVRFLNA